jgi:FlaA1/EpsC-like NDP-sugar epimerase
MDVANAIAPNLEKRIVGIRPGEKIHEEMITSSDSFTTYDLGKYYAILPQTTDWNLQEYIKHFNAKKVTKSFQYNSGENSDWLSIEDIRTLILKHLDENFSITSF